MSFKDLNLPEPIFRAIEKMEFTEATEVQQKCIPTIMSGIDVIGRSQTGSGKTLAFGIPLIAKIDPDFKGVQAIVICPTRELAMQVCEELRKIAYFKHGCKSVPLCGGCNFEKQLMALKKGARIVVGTPGRIQDHIRRGTLDLSSVNIAVLDEADEMLSMGFIADMENILSECNKERQNIMFSATMPKGILELTKKFMNEPTFIEIGEDNKPLDKINQNYLYINKADKKDALFSVLKKERPSLTIIFCNTKKMVDIVNKILKEGGYNSSAIHGDLPQSARKKVMSAVKGGECNILIATDVAARGIDINDVELVINYDIPNDLDYYIHRIGRTARAGKDGKAVTLIADKFEYSQLLELQDITKTELNEYINEFSKPVKPTIEKGKYEKRPSGRNSSRNSGGKSSGRSSEGRKFDDRRKSSSKKSNDKFGGDKFDFDYFDNLDENTENFDKKENRSGLDKKKSFRDGEKSFGDKKPYGDRKRSFGDGEKSFGDKKPFGDKKRSFGDGEKSFGDKKPYGDRKKSFGDGEKSFGDKKPYGDRKKSFGDGEKSFGDKKPYGDRKRSFGDGEKSFGDKKPFGDRKRSFGDGEKSFGDKKPFGDKKRSFGDGEKSFGDKKPYGDRKRSFGDGEKSFGDKKSYGNRKRSFGDGEKSFGDKKPYGDRKRSFGDGEKSFGDKKPFGDKKRSFGDGEKSFGDKKPYGDRKRSFGDGEKSFGDKKPYGDRKRSFGDGEKSFGDKKPYGDKKKSFGESKSYKKGGDFNKSSGFDKPKKNTAFKEKRFGR